jgi:penicillin-binding protein 2
VIGSSYHDGRLSAGSDPGVERRIAIIAVLVVVAFVIFSLRLFQLQIVEGADLLSRSERNFVRTLRLEAPRGEIVDREGRVLATTRPAYRVQVIPNELSDSKRTFGVLGNILEEPPMELRERVGVPHGRARFAPVVLSGDLSYQNFAEIESHRYALPGVLTDIRPRRDYLHQQQAAHVLGTIGEIAARQLSSERFEGYRAGEIVGQSGLEALLEAHLRGSEGGRNLVVDVAGREIETLDEIAPVPGGRVVLTLDWDLQVAAEEGFFPATPEEEPKMGAAVAMDPRTGEVLAIVSRPAYDPNGFAGGMDSEAWEELVGDPWKPLRNRAISGQYPPGSTYKVIVAIAGLSEAEVTPEETIFCPGYYRLGRRIYRCWKRGGHGDVGLIDALKFSCDVYFYQLGVKLGIDRIARYAREFGLGRMTGIDLPSESPGLIPTREWKERAKNEVWLKGETVSASIGQGYNLVTPLQLATSYSAIANGGTLHKPVLIKSIENWDRLESRSWATPEGRKIGVSKKVLEQIRTGLIAVVEGERGTGGRARVKGVEVAGKSRTTQVVSLDFVAGLEPEEIPIRYRDHALFVAFAPARDPEITVAVLVEHAGAGGGSVAAPIAQRVLARYFEKHPPMPAEPENAPSTPEPTVAPPSTPRPVERAQARHDAGLVRVAVASDSTVSAVSDRGASSPASTHPALPPSMRGEIE